MLAVQKNVKLPQHHILKVPNLHVNMAMLSLKSRGYVTEVFNWQWHYYFLTDAGVEYLRGYLHLPAEIIPATLKKAPIKALGGREEAFGGRGERRPFGDRKEGREGGYRREGGGFGRRPQGAEASAAQ